MVGRHLCLLVCYNIGRDRNNTLSLGVLLAVTRFQTIVSPQDLKPFLFLSSCNGVGPTSQSLCRYYLLSTSGFFVAQEMNHR